MKWAAIGDSFTYLNDHLDETGYRVRKGYLTRIQEKIPELELTNIGINGSTFADWIVQPIPKADLYTVLLGTNDWHAGFPLGDDSDFKMRRKGTILGHMGILLDHIHEANPTGRIIVGNPVERADFVYLLDPENNAPGSYQRENGQALSEVAAAILKCAASEGLETVNLHDLSGFAQEKLVKFKRVKGKDLPYPDYIGVRYEPGKDEYPYPPEAMALTYDGLHPSDEGNRILADLFAAKIIETMKR